MTKKIKRKPERKATAAPISAAQGAKIIKLFIKISGQLDRLERRAAA